MKATLKIEAIGDNTYRLLKNLQGAIGEAFVGSVPSRCWVAEIVGVDARFGFDREFVLCKTDYAKANSAGSRGVHHWFILESGKVYEVSAPKTWKRTDRYFCTVTDDGEIVTLEREAVDEWARKFIAA